MTLDIIIILVLLVSAGISFFRGLIKEVLTIVGLGGATIGTFLLGGKAVPMFENWIVNAEDEDVKFMGFLPDDIAAQLAAYAVVFIAIFLILALLGHFLSKGAEALGLGPVDRTLGIFFGLARGFLLVAILYLPFSVIMDQEDMPQFAQESRMLPAVEIGTNWTLELFGLDRPDLESEEDSKENETDLEKKSVEEKIKTKVIDQLRETYIDKAAEGADAPGGDAGDGSDAGADASGYETLDRNALEDLIIEKTLDTAIGGLNE